MFGAIGTVLGQGLRLIADWFDGANSAEMVANKRAQNLQVVKDAVTADVASGDLTKVEQDLSQ